MNKKELISLSEKELVGKLNESDWCDKELLKEYNERRKDGRIKFEVTLWPEELPGYFRKRREYKARKKAS